VKEVASLPARNFTCYKFARIRDKDFGGLFCAAWPHKITPQLT
jgi:hypothetical protein